MSRERTVLPFGRANALGLNVRLVSFLVRRDDPELPPELYWRTM
jgi:hypothetical protein